MLRDSYNIIKNIVGDTKKQDNLEHLHNVTEFKIHKICAAVCSIADKISTFISSSVGQENEIRYKDLKQMEVMMDVDNVINYNIGEMVEMEDE
jgi:hypothetical protein